jgi:hypothetical protein
MTMMTILLLLMVGAGAVVYGLAYDRRLRNDKQLLKAEIKKWEDEGGNVPEVPTVTPVVKPEKSVPAGS